MPIYVYVCEKCANREEHIQKFSDPPLKTCSKCHTDGLAKQVTAAAFHLRGGGWYKDGYASATTTSESTAGGEGAGGKEAKGTSGDASASCGAACPTPAACAPASE